MKHYIYYIAALVAGSLLAGCSADEPFGLKGEGRVKLATNISTQVTSVTRASADEQQLAESTIIWISNSKGVVRKFPTLSDVPTEGIKLLADNYVAEAWAGDSVPASFTDRYFYGSENFTVAGGSSSQVEITCRVANSVVAVNYSDDVDDVLSDYTLTVGHSQGSLTFEGRDERRGYFMMNSRDKDLEWTLTGKRNDGSTFERTGTIADAQRATLYTLNVKCTPQSEIIGGAYLTIEIDETTVDIEDVIEIVAAPSISGFNFDITQPIRGEMGSFGRRSVWITANAEITSLLLECPAFGELLCIGGNDFDFFHMDAKYAPMIEAGGIVYTYNYNSETDASTLKLTFEETFTSRLTNGEYPIAISVADANGKPAHATLTFSVDDAPVATVECDAAGVWSNRATVSGLILKDGVTPAIKYRSKGTQTWTDATDLNVSGTTFSAALTGLEPGTVYEYTAATDYFISPNILTFTTESEAQMPNSGFEDWSKSGSYIYLICGSGQERFWDSGNHGSCTAAAMGSSFGRSITTPAESPLHTGSYSMKMETASFLGTLAAGNAFVGEYLGTDGTNGVLGWGRSFTSRPAKLRGWVKYTPATVSKTADGAPDIVSGQPDKGIIYIALLDGSEGPKAGSYNGSAKYPVVVKTKSPGQYFSKNDANVIAYGEKVFDSATAGDGLIEFEIPLEYFHTDRKAAYILCTFSASKGGDYFAGGAGSVMYIDDLELVY